MKALVYDEKLFFKDVEQPAPRLGEALVRVLVAGICNTDLEITRGYMNFRGIPGHEFVGIVEQCENPVLKGKRVVGEINAGCGSCENCKMGDPRHCSGRTVLGIFQKDGAFAEYLTLPEINLHPVPEQIDTTAAVFTEPLAAALQIFEDQSIPHDSQIAVIGDGKLGQLIVIASKAGNYRTVLFGRHDHKLLIAARLGAETHHVTERYKETFRTVIECSGSSDGLKYALNIIEPKGTIILKSTYVGESGIDLSGIVVNEITIRGSRCGRFAPALELIEKEKIDTSGLISAVYPFKDSFKAFEHAGKHETLKILLNISSE